MTLWLPRLCSCLLQPGDGLWNPISCLWLPLKSQEMTVVSAQLLCHSLESRRTRRGFLLGGTLSTRDPVIEHPGRSRCCGRSVSQAHSSPCCWIIWFYFQLKPVKIFLFLYPSKWAVYLRFLSFVLDTKYFQNQKSFLFFWGFERAYPWESGCK